MLEITLERKYKINSPPPKKKKNDAQMSGFAFVIKTVSP